MDSILSFEHVTKRYTNGVEALKDISFSVRPGECIGVIGPSGSGKSTLLRAVNQLVSISEGRVLVDGEEVSAQKGRMLRASRRKIGMIFQNYNLVYRMSVMQNALHGRLGHLSGFAGVIGRYPETDKQRAIALLDELGLRDFIYNRASDLSGGQKQRVGIARAIMQEPKILLADEPIASLDPYSAKNIMDILRGMTEKRGIASIINLHQVNVATHYVTRIIGLHSGRIVFDDVPEMLTDSKIEQIYGSKLTNLVMGSDLSEVENTQERAG